MGGGFANAPVFVVERSDSQRVYRSRVVQHRKSSCSSLADSLVRMLQENEKTLEAPWIPKPTKRECRLSPDNPSLLLVVEHPKQRVCSSEITKRENSFAANEFVMLFRRQDLFQGTARTSVVDFAERSDYRDLNAFVVIGESSLHEAFDCASVRKLA